MVLTIVDSEVVDCEYDDVKKGDGEGDGEGKNVLVEEVVLAKVEIEVTDGEGNEGEYVVDVVDAVVITLLEVLTTVETKNVDTEDDIDEEVDEGDCDGDTELAD